MINKSIIIQFFRYLWIALGLALILFVVSQSLYTKRSLEYNLNFSETNTKDIRGWYPEQRIRGSSSVGVNNTFNIIGEPLYMKVYTPINFEVMDISGGILSSKEEDIRIGLKQDDGSCDFKKLEIIDNNFNTSFALEDAQVRNNQLEVILSMPSITSSSSVRLVDNWKIVLSR